MDNIINQLWEYAEKNNKRIYGWLNKDNLSSIVVDNGVFWYEMTSYAKMPNWVYYWLKRWGNKKGLTYLYDIPTKNKKGVKMSKRKCCGCPNDKEILFCGCDCHKEEFDKQGGK